MQKFLQDHGKAIFCRDKRPADKYSFVLSGKQFLNAAGKKHFLNNEELSSNAAGKTHLFMVVHYYFRDVTPPPFRQEHLERVFQNLKTYVGLPPPSLFFKFTRTFQVQYRTRNKSVSDNSILQPELLTKFKQKDGEGEAGEGERENLFEVLRIKMFFLPACLSKSLSDVDDQSGGIA